jgi:hypothetical protein
MIFLLITVKWSDLYQFHQRMKADIITLIGFQETLTKSAYIFSRHLYVSTHIHVYILPNYSLSGIGIILLFLYDNISKK